MAKRSKKARSKTKRFDAWRQRSPEERIDRVKRALGPDLIRKFGRSNQDRLNTYDTVRNNASQFVAEAIGAQSRAVTTIRGYSIGRRSPREPEPVVRIYVTDKRPMSDLNNRQRVPPDLHGIRTDVVAIGEVRAIASLGTGYSSIGSGYSSIGSGYSSIGTGYSGPPDTALLRELYERRCHHHRSVPGGVSISPIERLWSGTLGCYVTREDDPERPLALTNNHVAANWFTPKSVDEVPLGHAIVQPSMSDGEKESRTAAGALYDAIKLVSGGQPPPTPQVDAALLEINKPATHVLGWDRLDGTAEPYAFQTVVKAGRTTGLTLGLVYDLDVSIWVSYGLDVQGRELSCWFDDQLSVIGTAVNPTFSAPGDSGSIVVDYLASGAIGLLFAGSDSGLTFLNPIQDVLDAFGEGKRLKIE